MRSGAGEGEGEDKSKEMIYTECEEQQAQECGLGSNPSLHKWVSWTQDSVCNEHA